MQKFPKYIVNGITLYRIAAAPFLLYLIISGQFGLFKWLLGISFFTDAIDGFLARRYRVVSRLGSRLDSAGDDLTVFMAIIGICVYDAGFIEKEMFYVVLLTVLYLIQNVLALKKYGKLTTFHTYIAKVAAVAQAAFLLTFFFLENTSGMLFFVALYLTTVDLLEEIILVIILPDYQTDVKGLYWILTKKTK